MSILYVSYEVSPEYVTEVEAGAREIFAALENERPEGLGYALAKRPGGTGIVGLLELRDTTENPLPGLPAARMFQDSLTRWVVGEPPRPEPLEVIGSYGLFR